MDNASREIWLLLGFLSTDLVTAMAQELHSHLKGELEDLAREVVFQLLGILVCTLQERGQNVTVVTLHTPEEGEMSILRVTDKEINGETRLM